MKKSLLTILFLAFVFFANAQEMRIVTGTINSDDGSPAAGVNVIWLDSSNHALAGTVTDVNGFYQLKVPLGARIRFSLMGMNSFEMVVTRQNSLNLKGEHDSFPTDSVPAEIVSKKDSISVKKHFPIVFPDSKDDKTFSPYFFVQSDNPLEDKLPLKATHVEVNIAGVIADVVVKQIYVNEGKSTLEATYVFPGSTQAAVYGMTMVIGNRVLKARIREKEQARQEYEQAKQEGKTASLLEQFRPNVFQMSVANIRPKDSITVELHYTELLVPTEGIYEFVYPTVVGPRYTTSLEPWIAKSYKQLESEQTFDFKMKVNINSGVPIQEVSSPSHLVNIQKSNPKYCTIDYSDNGRDTLRKDFRVQYSLRGNAVESGVLIYRHQDENFFLMMMQPPKIPDIQQIPPREYIFIMDVSGSMHGYPISISKTVFEKLVTKLRPTDKFNILFFAGGNSVLSEESLPVNEKNIKKALKMIDDQNGSGGTELLPALQRALSMKADTNCARTFVIATDGEVSVEKEAFSLVRDNLGKANFFAFGIGESVNRYIIEGLAYAGKGENFIATSPDEGQEMAEKFIKYIEKPVLTHIKLNYENFNVYDVDPQIIPDVFAERPIIVFGKFKGETNGKINLSGYSGNEVYTQTMDLREQASRGNQALRYLWARNRIKYLDDYAGLFLQNSFNDRKPPITEEAIQQITKLGLKYNLLTQYTSFVAIDSLIRGNGNQESNQNIDPNAPPSTDKNQTLAINKETLKTNSASFKLSSSNQQIMDVVVTSTIKSSGLKNVDERDAASSRVRIDMMNGYQSSVSATDALQGRVSGLDIVNFNSTENDDTNIRIQMRTNNSIFIENKPLLLIDGVPTNSSSSKKIFSTGAFENNGIDFLVNINDIKSIELLKNPLTNLYYGSSFSNGILALETQKGKVGRMAIVYTSSIIFDKVGKLPKLQNKYAQGINGFWTSPETENSWSWGPQLSDLVFDGIATDYDKNGSLLPKGSGGKEAQAYNPYSIFKTGTTFYNHLKISGGGEKTRVYFSVSNQYSNGILPKTNSNKYNLVFNLSHYVNRKFVFSTINIFNIFKNNQVPRTASTSGIIYSILTTPPSFDNANGFSTKNAVKNEQTWLLSNGNERKAGKYADNPYWTINRNIYSDNELHYFGNHSIKYNISNLFTAEYKLGLNYCDTKTSIGFDKQSVANPIGQALWNDELYKEVYSNLRFLFNYSLKRSEINSSLEYTFANNEREVERTDGSGIKTIGDFSKGNFQNQNYLEQTYSQKNNSLNFSTYFKYNDIFGITFNAQNKWINSSSEKDNSLFSTSINSFLRLSKLLYIQDIEFINEFKIYSSLGTLQKEVPLFVSQDYFYQHSSNPLEAITYFDRVKILNNSNLLPEQNNVFEIGTELELFRNRVFVDVAYYRTKTKNLFVPNKFENNQISLQNGGKMSGSGIEISLTGEIIQKQNAKWTVSVNFSKNKSFVNELRNGIERINLTSYSSISSCVIAGQPYGVLYGTRYLRNSEGKIVIDENGLPKTNGVGILGDPNPDWRMGIENMLKLWKIEFSFLIDIKKGGKMWNGTSNSLNYYGMSEKTANLRNQTIVFDGVSESGNVNTISVQLTNNQTGFNYWQNIGVEGIAEDAIEDASWVRLREVKLNWSLPLHTSNQYIRCISIGIFGRNLWLKTKYSGTDPEANYSGLGSGLDYFNMPSTKSYGVTVKIEF